MSTTLTIRNLSEPVKQKLRIQAARHGRSMEAEAREILSRAVEDPKPSPPRTASVEMKEAGIATGFRQPCLELAEKAFSEFVR